MYCIFFKFAKVLNQKWILYTFYVQDFDKGTIQKIKYVPSRYEFESIYFCKKKKGYSNDVGMLYTLQS